MSDFDPDDNLDYEDQCRRSEDNEESAQDWYAELRTSGPPLNAGNVFYCSPDKQPIRVKEERFVKQLMWCLARIGMDMPLSQDLIVELYDRACRDVQQLDAIYAYDRRLSSDQFIQTLSFFKQEILKVERMHALVNKPREIEVPAHLAEWTTAWVDSLGDHLEEVLGHLRGQAGILCRHADWLKCHRTEIESHLLKLTYDYIVEFVPATPFARCPMKLLACYAHASGLVRYKDGGDFLQAIKMRVARVRKSRKALSVLALILAQSITGE